MFPLAPEKHQFESLLVDVNGPFDRICLKINQDKLLIFAAECVLNLVKTNHFFSPTVVVARHDFMMKLRSLNSVNGPRKGCYHLSKIIGIVHLVKLRVEFNKTKKKTYPPKGPRF